VDTLVEILATLVAVMAAAALSLFGVKIDAPHATAHKPPTISRTSEAASIPPAPAVGSAAALPRQPMAADCPLKKARPTAEKA
jgi:hypothetical protein